MLLLLAFVLLAFKNVYAQKDSTLTQKITAEFCNEFSKQGFTSFKDYELELGLVILPIIEKYKAEIEKEWHLSMETEEGMNKISEKIGQESARSCPKFLEFIKNNLSEIKEADEDEAKSISGVFQRIENNLFSILVIKSKTGKEEKLWWLQFFEGSDTLIENPTSLSRKNVTVTYTNMEVYDPKLKDHRVIKVVQSLTVN